MVIKQLYNGELYPYSNFKGTIEQLKTNRSKAFAGYEIFLDKLPQELKGEFNSLMDSHLSLLPQELEQNFIDGFCIGARMMTEVFNAIHSEN